MYSKLKTAVGERTTVHKASSNFESFRTTVPMSVVRQWQMKKGDKLDWEWKIFDGEMVLVVRHVKANNNNNNSKGNNSKK